MGVRNVKGRSAVRPLSVEAVEFSPTLDPERTVMSGQKGRVHASASVIEDDILVVQASEQRTVCNKDPGRVP